MLLGWARLFIAIVIVGLGWTGLSGTYGRRRESRSRASLGWAYRYHCCFHPSPDQERPEAILALLSWAGLIAIVVVASPAQTKNGRKRA